MAKKPFKAMTATALTAAFAASAIVPAATASAAEPAAAQTLSHYVIKAADGNFVQLSVQDFTDLKAAGKITGAAVQYVKAGDTVYTLSDFNEAKAAIGGGAAQADVIEVLAEDEDAAQEVELYEAEIGEDGTIGSGDQVEPPQTDVEKALAEATAAVNALPAVDAVKVSDKSAVAAAKALVADAKELGATVTDLETKVSALEAKIQQLEADAQAPKVESVTAINAKTLEVKFNNAVDTSKAQLTVKKGSVTVNVANVSFANDKKSATVELSSKLTKGDYTVNVTGLTTDALTKTVSVEDEKVAKIEVLSDAAVLDASNDKKVTVGYKVSNQYGEDITKTTTGLTVTSNASGVGSSTVASPSTGVIEITNGASYKTGDKISLSVLDATTSTFASKALTVSDKAAVSDVTVSGLYNEDSKAVLNTDATATDFHLLVNAKDQYGTEVPFGNIAGDVIVTTSDATVIDVKGGTAAPTFEQVTIDGKKQTVLELKAPTSGLKAGKATVSIISKTTGKVAQYVVDVQEGVKADAVTLTAPELAVAGEKTEIPFTVLGLDGAEITKASTLNGAKGVTVTDNDSSASVSIVNDTKTGKAKLVLDDTAGSSARNVILTVTSANGKVATLVVGVKEKAEAKVITATKDVVTDLAVGGTFKLNKDTLVVKDQYGRNLDLTGKLAVGTPTIADAGKYLIKVEKADTAADKVTVSATNVIASDNADVTVTGAKKGSEVVKLTLQKVDATGTAQNVVSSELDVNVKVAEKADIVSYELKNIAPIYDENIDSGTDAYKRDVVVYGVLADGKKVVVPTAQYTVVTSNTNLVYGTGQLNVPLNDGGVPTPTKVDIVGTDGKDVTVNVKVIVDATNGPVVLEQAVTVTKTAPKAAKVELKNASGITVADNVLTGALADVTDSADLKSVLKITDQYGEDISTTASTTLTATNLVNTDKDSTVPAVTGNGTSTLTFSGVEAADTFNLTYVVDGQTVTVKVIAE